MSFIEGKKNSEIAEALGISARSIANTKQRIIQKMKKKIN